MAYMVYIGKVIRNLRRNNLLPAILFRSSRSQCDGDTVAAAKDESLHLKKEDQEKIIEVIEKVIQKYDFDRDLVFSHPQYEALVTTGVGAHHAGQLLMWRLLLEELMTEGVLSVLVATGTVAAGVDFPARTVVITSDTTRGDSGFDTIASSQLQQMSGRAGRRGKDAVGFCIVAPSRYCDARQIHRVSQKKPEPLTSSYFPSPSTVLNILRYSDVEKLKLTVSKSLAAYKDKKEAESLRDESDKINSKLRRAYEDDLDEQVDIKKLQKRSRNLVNRAERLESKQEDLLQITLKGLEELGFLSGKVLSEKGYWASNICTNLVLHLANMISKKMLDEVTPVKLVSLVASISGDSHRKYLPTTTQLITKEEKAQISSIIANIDSYKITGVSEDLEVIEDAASTVVSWMNSGNWSEFRGWLSLAGVQEGDAARIITQTAEQLNQISRLQSTFPELASKAHMAKLRLLVPPLTEPIEVMEEF